jgi:hypothetical protein
VWRGRGKMRCPCLRALSCVQGVCNACVARGGTVAARAGRG